MASYKVGDTAELSFKITLLEVPTDPTLLDVAFISPTSGTLHKLWPSGDVERPRQGEFIARCLVAEPGLWSVVVTAIGAVEDIQTTEFEVEAAKVNTTIHVQDQSGVLADAQVDVFSNTSTLLASWLTNGVGNAVFQLLPGKYLVVVRKMKTAFTPVEIDVTTAGTFTILGESLAITTPAVAKLVRLFGHVRGGDGRSVAGTRIVVSTLGYASRSFVAPSASTDTGIDATNLMVVAERRELRTDADGYWEIDVTAETRVRVEVPSTRFQVTFRVPSDVLVLNLRDARPDPGPGDAVGIDFDAPTKEDMKGGG